jgi:3',5'-nucleoside bisphosphate phosphatase
MKRLLTAFKSAGGQALEVVTGRSNNDEISLFADYAVKFDMYGSVGSDFHNPQNQWVELGRLAPLPVKVKPVWGLLSQSSDSS